MEIQQVKESTHASVPSNETPHTSQATGLGLLRAPEVAADSASLLRIKSQLKVRLQFEWQEAYFKGVATPVNLEIDPSNQCPLGCAHCVWRGYLQKDRSMMPADKLLFLVREAADLGVRAITWAGGGEPLANPATVETIKLSHELGMDNGLFTNGLLLSKRNAEALARVLNWVRFNIGASHAAAYSEVHGVPPQVFQRVCERVKYFAKLFPRRHDSSIGTAVNRRNFAGVQRLPHLAAELGVGVFQPKPDINFWAIPDYQKWWQREVVPCFRKTADELRGVISVSGFEGALGRQSTRSGYCHAHHLATSITADGRVNFCKMLRDDAASSIGNIHQKSLKDIFRGERHEVIAGKIRPQDCDAAGICCPYGDLNEYLEEQMQLSASLDPVHLNFF